MKANTIQVMRKSTLELTTADVYNLIDKKVGEVSESIRRLENKFDTLEAGRLSNLESKFASLEGRLLAIGATIAFIISIGTSMASKLLA